MMTGVGGRQDNAKGINAMGVVMATAIVTRMRISSVCTIAVGAAADQVAGDAMQDLIVLLATLDLVIGEMDR